MAEPIAPLVVGRIERGWTATPRLLSGGLVIKISLRTSDEQTAMNRWASVHAQVENLIDEALAKLKGKAIESAAAQGVAAKARHDPYTLGLLRWMPRLGSASALKASGEPLYAIAGQVPSLSEAHGTGQGP